MPKGLRTLRLSFEDPHLTHFGGMVLLQRFCKRLRLRWRLQHGLRLSSHAGTYHPADLVLALLYGIMAGLRRINKTEILQYNGAFLSLLGLERFPDQSTLRRFLKRLPPASIRRLVRLHDQLRRELFDRPRARHSLILDLDSVVLTVYGKQQGGRRGYNPKKKGHRSYHPLLCFEAQQQEFWHGSLRPGNASPSSGAVEFLSRCLAKAPASIGRTRIRIRADAGFFGRRVIERLETQGCGYVIVAKEYAPIRARARAARFHPLMQGWAVGEFRYQLHNWSRPRRFVVIRRPLPQDPLEAHQLTLFHDRRYSYHVLVTNLPLQAWRVYKFYTEHATIEKNIRELLYDYPLAKIPTDEWVANVAFFQILLLAFDVMNWFKRLCLPPPYLSATLETLRTDFLVLPARLIRAENRNILHLPAEYTHRQDFETALRQVDRLRIPRNM